MDENGKVKGVGEDYGPLLWVWGTVSDVEQGDCVIESQIPVRERGNASLFTEYHFFYHLLF